MPIHYALIPAAGSGNRMGAEIPKQYQTLAGKPLIYHAISRLCTHPNIRQVLIVLAVGDSQFKRYDWSAFSDKLLPVYCGGATRAASVFNGLVAAHDLADADDWILVHDAARPCLDRATLDRLLHELADDDIGGLLAIPVSDTLKRANANSRAMATQPRERLWQAQTPQMFRYRLLFEALRAASTTGVTDESSAIESLALMPKLVAGSSRNIKVTYPEDLILAEIILKSIA
jgi:2-C-methyl-D-erythritol 4-phosphate cytidylyltransferase